MNIAAIITNINEAKNIKDYVDAYLIPLKDLSINYPNTFSLDEIKQIKTINKQIFVILNKNIHNNELSHLENTLKEIENLNINGIIFYDIAIVNLKQKLMLKTPLVWNQEHLATNYGTVNYWYDKGIKYTYGYIPMFTSRRHLVKNYLDTFNIKNNSNIHEIKKEGKSYKINDTEIGTTVYSNYILNAVDINFDNIDYLVFNSNLINEQDFLEVLKNYKNKKENKFQKETGFLYKETIYKVK